MKAYCIELSDEVAASLEVISNRAGYDIREFLQGVCGDLHKCEVSFESGEYDTFRTDNEIWRKRGWRFLFPMKFTLI